MKKSPSIFAITWLLLLSFSTNAVAQTAAPFSDPAVNRPTKENTVWNLAIPPEWGSETQNFRNANAAQNNRSGIAPVIYIQDAHCDYGAQKSIAALIENLSQEYRASHPAAEILIALEGAAGQLDLEPFRQFAATDAGRRVSDFYMRKGLLSGAEFAALNLGPHASLQGIEIPALYQKNRKSYRDASEKEKGAISLIRRLKARLEAEKQKIYSPGLLAVDQAENKFYAPGPHRMSLLEYADLLIRSEKSINTGQEDFWQKRYPHLCRLEKIRRAEGKINFQALEQEIGQMLFEIKARSHDSDSQGLTQWAEVEETGDYAKFAKRLFKNAAELEIALNNYPEIRRYQRYLRLLDEMEGPRIFEELDAWTEAVKTLLYRSPLEKAKDEETRFLRFAEKVTRLEATRSELEFVERMGGGGKISGELKALLEPALRFYADARRRDQALFENFRSGLLASQKNRVSKPLVFLVTGGFHSEALGTLFRKHDIPYRMLVPRFQRGEEQSPYAELMRGRISPLQKIAAVFDYDAGKALEQENRAKVRLEDGRQVFYRFHFNAGALNASPQKIDSVELVEAEFSPAPFTNKPEKSFPAQGRFGKPLNRKEKPFTDRIKTIQTRKQKLFSALSAGSRTVKELEEILSRLSKEKLGRAAGPGQSGRAADGGLDKLALEPFLYKPPSRFEFVVAQFKAAAVGFSQTPPQPSTRAASLGQPGRAAGGGLSKQALAGSLGTEPLHYDDTYDFQELVDTLREKFDAYFFEIERGSGPVSEFETESGFLQYAYAMVYTYSLEDVLKAFIQIRTVLGMEKSFVRDAAQIITAQTAQNLDEAGYDRKIQKLDETAAEISIYAVKGRALKRFESIDFKPELLDESQPEVYAEGLKRLTGLLQAYSEIASRPGWAHRYNDEKDRSILDPRIAKDIKTRDMLPNLLTEEKAAERTLEIKWGELTHEGRADLFRILENGHWAYLVVNRLIHEIGKSDFPKMREALEKQGTDEAHRLLSYITPPPDSENAAAPGLSALKLEKLEAAYRDLYEGKIMGRVLFRRGETSWYTADGIFVPSTLTEISRIFSQVGLKPGEKLLDLGSGDGRVLFTAAYLFGAEAHGYETDWRSRELSVAMKSHLAVRPDTKDEFDISKARIFADTFLSDEADWSQYNVIYYYDLGADFKGDASRFLEKLETMKPGALFIIHQNFLFDENLRPFLEHIDTLQLTERSRPTQIYRKPLRPAANSLGALDEGQRRASELGINPQLIAPGLRLDEKGEGYLEPRSPDEEISREEKNRLREEKIRWWLDSHELGNKPTNEGVRKMVSKGETRLRDEYRIYFVGKVPDEAEEDEGWYTAHQILHDVFLVSLTAEERREFFYLVKHADEAYHNNPAGGSWNPSLLYFLVDEKILDDSKEKHPLQTYNGLIWMSETFARLAGHYLGLPYPPDSADGKDHYDFHEEIFHPFFDKIGLRAASLGNDDVRLRAPQEFWNFIKTWNERYQKEGSHLAFQQKDVALLSGMGSVQEFDFLKQAIRALLGDQAPGGSGQPGLSGKDWIESPHEFQSILTYLQDKKLLAPEESLSLSKAYEFLDTVSQIYAQNRLSNEESLGPESISMRPFFKALAQKRGETLPPAEEDVEKTKKYFEERLEKFYREYYEQASLAFEAITRLVPSLYEKLHSSQPEMTEAIDPYFVIRKREGLHFDLKKGFEEGVTFEIGFKPGLYPALFYKDHPELLFRVFEHAVTYQLSPGQEVLNAIRENAAVFSAFLEREKNIPGSAALAELHGSFLNIFRTSHDISKVVWQLHHLKILDIYIPHYARVRNLFTESVHRFSVDMHTIYNIELMESLAESVEPAFETARSVYRKIRMNPDQIMMLRLGLLFHDIGKGLYSPFGPGHAVTGAQDIVPPALESMGVRPAQIRQVAWLVRYHMALTAAADRVKSHPEELYQKTLELLSDPGIDPFLLNGLFVISFADKFAVDPAKRHKLLLTQGASSPLTALDMLYQAASKILTHPTQDRLRAVEEIKEEIRKKDRGFLGELEAELEQELAGGKHDSILDTYLKGIEEEDLKEQSIREEILEALTPANFKSLFDAYASLLPVSYIRTLGSEKIFRQLIFLRHLEVLRKHNIKTALVLFDEFPYQYETFYEVLVGLTHDEPGLLSKITGVLSANGIDIFGAEVNTSKNGMGMDRFFGFFTSPEDDLRTLEKQVGHDLREVISGDVPVRILFEHRGMMYGSKKKPTGALDRAPLIQFEGNSTVDDIPVSVMNVEAMDRMSLLHFLTLAAAQRGINIVKVSAATYHHLAKDTFFINKNGRPLSVDEQNEFGAYLFGILSRDVIYGASLGEDIERWVFLGKGEALSEAPAVEKTAIDAAILEPALHELEKSIQALGRRKQAEKAIGLRVLARLRELATQEKIYGFDELRWAEESNLFAFTSPEFLALGRGYFNPGLFTLREQAQALFYLGMRHMTLREKDFEPYESETVLHALEKKLFPQSAFAKKAAHFRHLSAPEFLNAALDRFNAFEPGSPYFGTMNLFDQWMKADMKGRTIPVFRQAAYLMKVFFENTSVGPKIIAGTYQEADEVPAQDREMVLKSYFKVIIPLTAFAIFRDEFLDSVGSIRKNLVTGVEEDTREHKIPMRKVDVQGSIMAYLRKKEPPYNSFVAFLTNMPGPFPAEGFTLQDLEQQVQKFNDLGLRAIDNKPWLDRKLEEIKRHKDSGESFKHIEVPGAGWTDIGSLAAHFAFLTHQTWNGWSHVVNSGPNETLGFGLQMAKDVQQNHAVRVVTMDAVPTGGMFNPRSFSRQSYKYAADTLIVQRSRQTVVRDLLHWFRRDFKSVSTKREDFFPFLYALLKTRKNLTPPTVDLKLPHARYSLQGVDPIPWSGAILKLAGLNDLAFWPMVKAYYGSMQSFVEFGEGKTQDDDDITLFWYYSMFTHPRGIFAWLAGKHPDHLVPLRYIENTKQLTDESGRNLLDALMGIFWSGPLGNNEIAHRKALLFSKFLDFVRLTPNGIFISNPEGFEKFLTQDLTAEDTPGKPGVSGAVPARVHMLRAGGRAERGPLTEEVLTSPSMQHFEAWRAKRFPGDIPEDPTLGHVILTKEPQPGEAEILVQDQPSYYYPMIIQPEDLLFPEKWRWNQAHEPSIAVYVAEYQEGLVVPAPPDKISFKYLIQGVANGTPLRVAVFPDGNVLIQKAYKNAEEAAPAYVKIPLAQAQGGFIPPQKTWHRIPLVDPALHPSRFYHVSVADDGLAILRLGERVISLAAPALAGKELLVEIHQGTLHLYDTAAAAYAGNVSFNGKVVLERASVDLSLLPELPESVRDNHFQTVKEHAALRTLAANLADTMKLGFGYQKIVISEEHEIRLEKDKIFLPRTYLDTPETAAAAVKAYLFSEDPLGKLQKQVADLSALENSPDVLVSTTPIPDDPDLVPDPVLQSWSGLARGQYQSLWAEIKEIRRRLTILQNIGSYRQQFGTSGISALRKSLSKALQQEPEDFLFITPSGTIFHKLKDMKNSQGSFYDHEGAGYITDQSYALDKEQDLVLEERSHAAAETPRRLIFVRFRNGGKSEGKFVLLLFDAETGQLFDEEKKQLATKQAQLDEAVPLLKSEPGLKDEFWKTLSRMETMTQQIQLLDYFNQFLPKLLVSSFPQINTVMLRLVLAAVARGGFEQVQRLAQQLAGGVPVRFMNELELLLMHFDLHPGDKPEDDAGYSKKFQEFVNGVLIPMAQSPWEGAPDFSEPSYFERLTQHLTGLRHQIEALWNLGSIRAEESVYKWDGQMAQRFGLVARETDEPNSIHQYFIKLGPGTETPVEIETEAVTAGEQRMPRAEHRQRATHLTFLGGVEGIGASSMEVAYQGMETRDWTRILVDAGSHLDNFNTPPAYRYLKQDPENLPHAIFLTHSHIDHIGSAVFLYRLLGKKVPFYATRGTVDLLRITLHAMVRDAKRTMQEQEYEDTLPHFFTEEEVEEFLKNIIAVDPVKYDENSAPVYPVLAVSPKMKVQFHHAGHLHGAASLIVMTPDGNTFISGDLSKRGQGAVKGFREWPVDMPPIHTAIVESTYGTILRESEDEQEELLVQNIIKVLNRGGKVLLPAYANGRAPRLLEVILKKMDQFPVRIRHNLKIFVDGMAEAFTAAYQKVYPELRDGRIELVGNKFPTPREGFEYREDHILERTEKEPTIIIASSANLQGMSAWYAKKLVNDLQNGIFFTGYMDPLEPASAIMDLRAGETFRLRPEDEPVPVNAERASFKLSGHASGNEILEILETLDRSGNESLKRVIFVHGHQKARMEMIEAVKTLKKDQWHPIDTRVGHTVMSVVEPDNKPAFDNIPATPIAVYQAASLGIESMEDHDHGFLTELAERMKKIASGQNAWKFRSLERHLAQTGTLTESEIADAQNLLIEEAIQARLSAFFENELINAEKIADWATAALRAIEQGTPLSLNASEQQSRTLRDAVDSYTRRQGIHPTTRRTVKGILKKVFATNAKSQAKTFVEVKDQTVAMRSAMLEQIETMDPWQLAAAQYQIQGASLGAADLQAKLNELFGIPENKPWEFAGASRSYAVHSTPFYYRVGDLFYLPYADQDFQSHLVGYVTRQFHPGWDLYRDPARYRNLLGQLAPYRENWVVSRLRPGFLTTDLDFASSFYTLSAILGLMESRDLLSGLDVLVAGSGGGIQVFTASRLGARRALGIDKENDLVTMAKNIAFLNGAGNRVGFETVDFKNASEKTQGRFDYIVTNLDDWGLFPMEDDTASAEDGVPVGNWNGLLLEQFPGAQYYLAAGGRFDRNLSDWTEAIMNEHFRRVDIPVRIPSARGDYGAFLGRDRKIRAQSLGIQTHHPLTEAKQMAIEIDQVLEEMNPLRVMTRETDMGIFGPSDLTDVARMLEWIQERYPDKKNYLSVGSGDGGDSILASRMGFEAAGLEYDTDLMDIAHRAELQISGVDEEKGIHWIEDDFFKTDLDWDKIDVVFYYDRGSKDNNEIFEKLKEKMRPGALLIVYRQAMIDPGNMEKAFDLKPVRGGRFNSIFEGHSWESFVYEKFAARSLGEVIPLFDPEKANASKNKIQEIAVTLAQAENILGLEKTMDEIDRRTDLYLKEITRAHQAAVDEKLKSLETKQAISAAPEQNAATAFLKRAFPAEAHLAVIFSVSDAAAPYSLESLSYRDAIRTVLENPLVVIRIAHAGSSPEQVKAFQREFAVFGSRIQIESAEREHLPYVLNGFFNDELLNQVKSLSGQKGLKQTELIQFISVVAEEEVLNQFGKIALGGKELVSLVHSKILKGKDAAFIEGAMLFEWGMAHWVASHQADEIRREISEEELAIRGNRFIPNEAGLTEFLALLGEAWQGIQQTLRAA